MAKYERAFTGDFDTVLEKLHDGILNGSASASYEDGSDYCAGDFRCAVRVYERYSWTGGNRVFWTPSGKRRTGCDRHRQKREVTV